MKKWLQDNLPLRAKLNIRRVLSRTGISRSAVVRPEIGKQPFDLGSKHNPTHQTVPAADRTSAPKIIVFDDRVPTPDRDAGSARMFHILRTLSELGPTVFVPINSLPEYEALLWKEGIETADAVEYLRLVRQRQFSVAIMSRPEVAEALMTSIRRADKNLKVVFDMVDAYFIRLRREFELTGDPKRLSESLGYEKLELKLARAADQVWCASSEDKKVVSKSVSLERVMVIPTIHPLHDRGNSFEEREGLMFIGNLHHRPNSDAVHYFVNAILPLLRKTIPGINFYVVGEGASAEILDYQSDSVHILGYVPIVDPVFHNVRLFVAPLRFGAGMKGKIGEALSYGLPVVTTSIGAEGFGLTSGDDVMVADEPDEFAAAVLRVYREKQLWQRLANNGYAHIERTLTPKVIELSIREGLARLGAIKH